MNDLFAVLEFIDNTVGFIVLPTAFMEVMRNRTVRGTLLRYRLRSALVVCFPPTVFTVWISFILAVADYGSPSLWGNADNIFTGLIATTWTLWYVRFLRDDDDDWFKRQGKKLKRWIKSHRPQRVRHVGWQGA